jgi:predicted ArsR family transcriptional regulator
MAPCALSPAVVTFLRENIVSYDDLEILLLMQRRREPWSSEALAAEVHMHVSTVEKALERLQQRDLLESRRLGQRAAYRFNPQDPLTTEQVKAVERAYDTDRIGVMNAMNANAMDRIRNQALHVFAHAFVVVGKKGRNDG